MMPNASRHSDDMPGKTSSINFATTMPSDHLSRTEIKFSYTFSEIARGFCVPTSPAKQCSHADLTISTLEHVTIIAAVLCVDGDHSASYDSAGASRRFLSPQ